MKKRYVLDTNVLLHDPNSLFRFKKHDVIIPLIVLEELDNHKKGMADTARNARQVSRMLDRIIQDDDMCLSDASGGIANGRLVFDAYEKSEAETADNCIIQCAIDRGAILVSKDINVRIKAKIRGCQAEDYQYDQVDDSDNAYTGVIDKPLFWLDENLTNSDMAKSGNILHVKQKLPCNTMVRIDGKNYIAKDNGEVTKLQSLYDHGTKKGAIWGVQAKNEEQNFALNLLMDKDIDFVTLLGPAGTGKTLLTLAAGLQQCFEDRLYNEIIVTRATVPIGDDIGYLPGTEEEKMTPWMGAITDNIEVLLSEEEKDSWSKGATRDLIASRIKIKSMSFMRGRTFTNKFLIIDEAQNLTAKQMKALITRAGEGTKVVCLGNLAQIDTLYLTEGSSGLAVAVSKFQGWPHHGHITLQKGERSRLSDRANEVM